MIKMLWANRQSGLLWGRGDHTVNPALILIKLFLVSLAVLLLSLAATAQAAAPGDIEQCSVAVNLSNSPGYSSADPFLLADPVGMVHLFWAERVTGEPGAVPNTPDALLYSFWDGAKWSEPIDIFLSPREYFNRRITSPRAVIDDQRTIHLIWIGPDNTFFYSSAPASEAGNARAWQEPTLLSSTQSGTQMSIHIAYEAPETLHVIYANGTGDDGGNNSVSYIRSRNRGQHWSEPIDIYRVIYPDRGASNTRLLVGESGELYATWTEWDQSGNGQAVYFARSLNGGQSWNRPVLLDERVGEEYERDWTTLATLDDDRLVAFWEGGLRAYRQAQYSNDGGETWSDPVDTLDWLIADNGFAEFVRDSAGRLHLFVFQRVRSGNSDKGIREGLWHTVWEGGREWREPKLIGRPNPGNYVTVALSGGNQLFAAWFDFTNLEVNAMRCMIEGAPAVEPQAPPSQSASAVEPTGTEPTPVPEATEATGGVEATPPAASRSFSTDVASPGAALATPGSTLAVSLLPTMLLLVLGAIVLQVRRRGE